MTHPLVELAYGCANASHTAHLAHFNVVGPNFGELHKLYQSVYEYLDEWFDTFGERVRALDTPFEARSILPNKAAGKLGALNGVVLADLVDLQRQACAVTDSFAEDDGDTDPTSANMVSDFQAGLDKLRWMVRSTTIQP